MCFAQHETWFTAGGAFGNSFMNGKDLESSYTGFPGVNLSNYTFFNQKNIGIFCNYGILFPTVNNLGNNYAPSFQLDFILLGAGFGYDINENMKLYFGIGPDMNMLFFHSDKDSGTSKGDYFIGLGIGGDIGLKFNITNLICLNVGTTLSYNFAAYREIRSINNWDDQKTESSGWVSRYSMIDVKPYIAIGFYFDNVTSYSHKKDGA
jgi:opacity protein-like surface antigen